MRKYFFYRALMILGLIHAIAALFGFGVYIGLLIYQ